MGGCSHPEGSLCPLNPELCGPLHRTPLKRLATTLRSPRICRGWTVLVISTAMLQLIAVFPDVDGHALGGDLQGHLPQLL